MAMIKKHAGSPLGDLRAEHDHVMLDAAFYKTPDFLTLIESHDKTVVVGRRGVGKSALVYKLSKHWSAQQNTRVLELSLDKAQVLALSPLIQAFERYSLISVACEKCWKYVTIMELLSAVPEYKLSKLDREGLLHTRLRQWRASGFEVTAKLRRTLEGVIVAEDSPEQRLPRLLDALRLDELERAFQSTLDDVGLNFCILVDRLDEGYEPTSAGVGLVDGIITATIDANAHYQGVQTVLFVRDNLFRTIAKRNPDFSRNIEGQALRLHWNEYHLMNMVTGRMRVAFKCEEDQPLRIWNRFAARELRGREGFRHCLQLTLYRPRDILLLLNSAFCNAAKEERAEIVPADVTVAGKTISTSRLDDLHKEYTSVIPGLEYLTDVFRNAKPEFTVEDARAALQPVLSSTKYTTAVMQEFAILAEPIDVLRALYGIGFIGIRDSQDRFVFCHDGNSPDKGIGGDEVFLVHPCYWMALNIVGDPLSPDAASDIHDEAEGRGDYDIAVTEPNIDQRAAKLGEQIARLGNIPAGEAGQRDFEKWALQAVQTVFAGSLGDLKLWGPSQAQHGNYVWAVNYGRSESWKALITDFGCSQVLFRVCNSDMVPRCVYEECAREAAGTGSRAAFLLTRDDGTEVRADNELSWLREIVREQKVMVLRITGKFLATLLGKLRNPQKHDAVEVAISGLLTMYRRNHLKGMADALAAAAEPLDQTVSIQVPAADCFGEIGIDDRTGKPQLGVYKRSVAGGAKSPVCPAIDLKPQAWHLLQAGQSDARRHYIAQQQEQARLQGAPIDPSECELPPEKSLLLEWTQDDLAKIVCNRDRFADLKKQQKEQIKSAVSRLRGLVRFENDDLGLVTDAEGGRRHSTIPIRLAK